MLRAFLGAVVVSVCALSAAQAWAGFNFLSLSGLAEQGNIFYGQTSSKTSLIVGVDDVPVTENGEFVFGIPRDAGENLEIISVDEYGMEMRKNLKIKQVNWPDYEEEGLPEYMVNPDAVYMENIIKDSDAMKTARSIVSGQFFPRCFSMPVENAKVSLDFGVGRVKNGVRKQYHGGVDFEANEGDTVMAAADGIVTHINTNGYYNGKTVIIDHGYGISSTYAHLSKIDVSIGQTVARGDKIGEAGNTGCSVKPHLHFGLHYRLMPISPLKAILVTQNNCNKQNN